MARRNFCSCAASASAIAVARGRFCFLFCAYVTSLGMLLSEVIANAEALLSQWFGIKTLLLLRAICHHLARLLSEKQEYTGVAFEQLLLEEAAKHNRVCRGPNWLTSMELDSIRHGVKGVVRAYDALQLSRLRNHSQSFFQQRPTQTVLRDWLVLSLLCCSGARRRTRANALHCAR